MDWERHQDSWPHATHSRFVFCKPHRWHVQEMGEGPLLMLIHGAGGATQSWRHLMPLLAQHYHVVAVDLPGQGFTRSGAQQRMGLVPMAQDLTGLCLDQDWQPAVLIGHSAGAAIALEMAQHRSPAPPVVGLNAALGTFKGLAGVLFPLMAKALAMTPWVARLFTASTSRPGSVTRLIKGTGSDLPSEDLRWYRALVSDEAHVDGTLAMMAQWDLTPLQRALPSHPSRTLLIVGENDRTVPPSTSRDVAARIPDCKMMSLPGLGHLAHEENAEAVFAAMADFLRENAVSD
ncbi:alpha/beta fold hydrolase BchO [Marimonas sp. MJW-29]|uniref:Alpha/beta fold hydrolase BchO n=1 Tax=Sulfitobacter sediminis TaxID=3234186 RepID=A0ABV3RRW7_9RHOB